MGSGHGILVGTSTTSPACSRATSGWRLVTQTRVGGDAAQLSARSSSAFDGARAQAEGHLYATKTRQDA